MKIIVASKNAVKCEAIRLGYGRMFPGQAFEIEGLSVSSGVSDQPMGDEETLAGAQNRLKAIQEAAPDADVWAAIEGGCADTEIGFSVSAWVVIASRDGRQGKARTSTFYLPQAVVDLVRSGMELGHADDQVFGRTNSKEQNGACGILTNDVVTRTEYYAAAAALALIPMKNPTLY